MGGCRTASKLWAFSSVGVRQGLTQAKLPEELIDTWGSEALLSPPIRDSATATTEGARPGEHGSRRPPCPRPPVNGPGRPWVSIPPTVVREALEAAGVLAPEVERMAATGLRQGRQTAVRVDRHPP